MPGRGATLHGSSPTDICVRRVNVSSVSTKNLIRTKLSRHVTDSLQVELGPHRQRSWKLLNLIIHFCGTKGFLSLGEHKRVSGRPNAIHVNVVGLTEWWNTDVL